MCVLDFDLQGSAVGCRARLGENEPGGVDKLDILPFRVSPKARRGHFSGDLSIVRSDDGDGGELEYGVSRPDQNMGVLLPGFEFV